MRPRRACLLAALVVALLAVVGAWAAVAVWERLASGESAERPRAVAGPAAERSPPGDASEPGFTVIRRTGPVRARRPRSEDLALARQALSGGGRQARCGPYDLYTDVPGDRLIAACGRLAEGLEDEYTRRFGVEPTGAPAEAIFLFRDRKGLRRFTGSIAERSGRPRLTGYAGHASAARGYVALHADSRDPDPTLRTLVHELTHLLNRRALGPELPRWLAEGMADAIGDRATEDGLLPLAGVRGSEGEAKRLRLALDAGQIGSVERLLALAPGEFDRGVVSYDYEQSAMLVRFLLDQPDLTPRLRTALSDLAAGEGYEAGRFLGQLGLTAAQLDRRFEAWVRRSG